jgi:large subunit ribosomal protein L21
VMGKITRQAKNRKVVVFKFRRRKGYRRKTGHRQAFTQVRIEKIGAGNE